MAELLHRRGREAELREAGMVGLQMVHDKGHVAVPVSELIGLRATVVES